jgi:RimJ/RimL family protein N-acetyltransferase
VDVILQMRPAVPGDAEAVWAYRTKAGVSDWLTSGPGPLAEWSAAFATPERLATTLIGLVDGVVMADLMIMVGDPWAQAEVRERAAGTQAEIGWVLDPSYAGRGLGTQAGRLLLERCFGELGLRRVTAGCFADNVASWRIMERLGMRREEHAVRASLHRDGTWRDGYSYAILREEWTG